MKKLKKNGFTLIELLSVVVILGIIMTLVVAGYNIYISKTNKTYYESLADIFRTAVIDYYSDNLGKLPQNIGDEKEVKSPVLLDKNYLESFVDTNEDVCDGVGIAHKKATGKYEYTTCIRCPGYNNNSWYGDGCDESIINSGGNYGDDNRNYEIISDGPDTYGQGKDAYGNYGDTIIRVPDAIIKGNGTQLNTTLSPKPPTIDTKVPHNTVYKVYYQYQNEYIEKKITVVDDTKPPIDVVAKYKSTNLDYPAATWTKDDVVVTITTNDWTIASELMGSGVDKVQISSDNGSTWNNLSFTTNASKIVTATTTISTDGGIEYQFRTLDKAGNSSEVIKYKIYIDKEDPKFTSGYPTVATSVSGYNSKNPIVTLKATDNLEVTEMCVSTTSYTGCTWEPYKDSINWGNLSNHLDGTSKTFYISVKDIAGNVVKTTKTYKLTTSGLACGTYAKKASVSYAGLNWYVLSDNGTNTTLILKTNSNGTQTYGSSTTWSSSNAKSKVTTWFNSKANLVLDQKTTYIINDGTYGIVRIPTKAEATGVANDSGTPYWTLTASGSSMWYAKKDGTFTYRTYYTQRQSSTACYYGYQKSSISSMKKKHDDIKSGTTYNTTAAPNTSSNYIDWTYSQTNKPCASNVTDSSEKGPNSGHYGYGPFEDEGPFCADIAPYYGDCKWGSNFCPSSSGSTSNCNRTYRRFTINQNKGNMGLRPVIQVQERC